RSTEDNVARVGGDGEHSCTRHPARSLIMTTMVASRRRTDRSACPFHTASQRPDQGSPPAFIKGVVWGAVRAVAAKKLNCRVPNGQEAGRNVPCRRAMRERRAMPPIRKVMAARSTEPSTIPPVGCSNVIQRIASEATAAYEKVKAQKLGANGVFT